MQIREIIFVFGGKSTFTRKKICLNKEIPPQFIQIKYDVSLQNSVELLVRVMSVAEVVLNRDEVYVL